MPRQTPTVNVSRESEAFYRVMVDHSLTGIVAIQDGVFHHANPGFASIMGLERAEDALGRPFLDFVHPDDRELVEERHRLRLAGAEAPERYEIRGLRRDGSTVWLELQAAAGNFHDRPAVVCNLLDITQRKSMEAAHRAHLFLLESLEQVDRAIRRSSDLEQMMEDVLDAVLDRFECDRAWLLYPCDPRAASWRVPMERTRQGWAGAMAMGQEIPMLPEAMQAFEAALRSDGPVAYDPESEHALPPQVSSQFSIRSQIILAVNPKQGKPWLFGLHQCSHARVWTTADRELVQEIGRRLADGLTSLLFLRSLRDSEENYREVVEGTDDVIARLDSGGRITFVNGAGAALLGQTHEACVGQPLPDLLHPEDRQGARTQVKEWVRQRRTSATLDGRVVDHAGTLRHVSWTVNFRFDDKGWLEDVGVVGRDISERVRAEEERLHLERQLQHAQKLESLGVLAGGIAHDFNNILMGVLGNAELALLGLAPESPARENVAAIEAAAVRAADLARQMLAYSGKGRFVVETIDVNRIVEEMAHLLQTAVSKKAALRLDLAEVPPRVEADATQIRQVFMNLITNAADALGDENGVVTLRTGLTELSASSLLGMFPDEDIGEGRYAFVEVSDTGCGMDPVTAAKIFDPFFTTKTTGRGLGLAAVLGIVRGHGGAIKVYSEPGRGTAVKVFLPALDSAAPAVTCSSYHHSEGSAGERRHGAGTVLVVDDETAVRDVARQALERFGFTVLEAADGLAAVEVFRQHADRVGVVVLDMTMPRLSGPDAYRQLRGIRPDIAVILSSGYNEQDATGPLAGRGLAGFIQKPYRPTELVEQVRIAMRTAGDCT